MAKTFKPRQKKVNAIQWDGKNIEEIRSLVEGGKAHASGTSLIITTKFSSLMLNRNEYVSKDDDGKIVTMTEQEFKDKYEEEKDESKS